jgi:integrase
MKNWLEFLKGHYNRDLGPDNFIFPSVGSNTTLQPASHISHDIIQQWIDEFASESGIVLKVGRLTTHCFRRGGAQDRFMAAPIGSRWSLAVVRWWGGWSPGEQVSLYH